MSDLPNPPQVPAEILRIVIIGVQPDSIPGGYSFAISELSHSLKPDAKGDEILDEIEAQNISTAAPTIGLEKQSNLLIANPAPYTRAPTPFDQILTQASRVVFYLNVPNWFFDDVMFALKDPSQNTDASGNREFGGLQWVHRTGEPVERSAIEITGTHRREDEVFPFTLFIYIMQLVRGEAMRTKLLIDPEFKNEG